MKIALEGADARGLRLDLPGGEVILVREAEGLLGVVESSAERLAASGVAASKVLLGALRLLLGSLELASADGALLRGLVLALEQGTDRLVVDLTAVEVISPALRIAVDGIVIEARVVLRGARLELRSEAGRLSAERVELQGARLQTTSLELGGEVLDGGGVSIAWGTAAGFTLSAASLASPELRVVSGGLQVAARGVALAGFQLEGSVIRATGAEVAEVDLAITLGSEPAPAPSGRPPMAPVANEAATEGAAERPAAALVDLRVLDALSGQVDVDVAVDLTVPIIGRRNATHRLRVAIEHGTIDFRALEDNLAALEDAILDFSVREGALVLERVNPLLPARGHGKPIVTWALDPQGMELAGRDRVRLAILPAARLADGGDAASGEKTKEGGVALRSLGLLDVHAALSLASVDPGSGQIRPRSVGSLVLRGTVHHDPGASPKGSLGGELRDLALALTALQAGTSVIDVESLVLAGAQPIDLTFAGTTLTQVRAVLSCLELASLSVRL